MRKKTFNKEKNDLFLESSVVTNVVSFDTTNLE